MTDDMAFPADTMLDCALRASPNFGERRGGATPDMLILHYTGMGGATQAVDWLASRESGVSSHYVVHEDGRVLQMVPEAARAWHAGAGSWRGRSDINSHSIGIEIVNAGHDGGLPAYPAAQIVAVTALCADILRRWPIRPEWVLGHSDVAPARKEDPGERFPWEALAGAGVGHWVEPLPVSGGRYFGLGDEGQPVEAYQTMLAAYGYGVTADGCFGEVTRLATVAFQRHFRPAKVDGIADMSTIGTLHRLLGALPRSPFETGRAMAGA